jgi:hypothetical protein
MVRTRCNQLNIEDMNKMLETQIQQVKEVLCKSNLRPQSITISAPCFISATWDTNELCKKWEKMVWPSQGRIAPIAPCLRVVSRRLARHMKKLILGKKKQVSKILQVSLQKTV